MKINLLKFNDNQWVLIPPRNTVQEILDILNKSKKSFEDLLKENFINDKEGQPDILKASEISLRCYNEETEFDFELFECF